MPLEVKENAFEVSFVEELLVFSSAEEERGAADIVDQAGDALSVMVKGGDERIGEELVWKTGEMEVMFDISGGFFKVERGEGITDGDALIESLVGGEAEFSVQVWLPNEDEGEEGT